MARASETDRIQATLDGLPRSSPPSPTIVGTDFELGTDQADDPAVFIVVFLDERTKDKDWISTKLDPIADTIRNALREAGVERWVYVRFARPSDLKAAG